MITFFVFNDVKRKCAALSAAKATEIIKLIFPGKKAYVIEDNNVPFAQNMSVEEAKLDAGIKPQPMMIPEVVKKPVAKKTKVKSKVVVKAKTKPVAKKTKVKSKVVVKKAKAKPVVKKAKPVVKKAKRK